MKMFENKAYNLIWLENGFIQIIVIKSNGFIKIYKRYIDNGEFIDKLWIDDEFRDVEIIMKSGYDSDEKYCYVHLIDSLGYNSILEIVNKKPILQDYQYNHIKMVFKRIEPEQFHKPVVEEVVYRVLNKRKKIYALYSLKKGFLFGPYEYKEIDMNNGGVILDKKYAVENYGEVLDLSNYEKLGYEIYFDKEKDKYLLFLDQKDGMFIHMYEDDVDNNIVCAETEYEIFKYDKTTGECTCEPLRGFSGITDWSQYNDIVYEGHSRLELGLDD